MNGKKKVEMETSTEKSPEKDHEGAPSRVASAGTRTRPLPGALEDVDPSVSYAVPVGLINVPKERVTAVYDAALEEEFFNSVESQGVKDDVQLWLIEGGLWLDDGLHRILAAEKLGFSSVPAKIQKGSVADLLMSNIVHARQRGRSNPAQESDVLAKLVNDMHFPMSTAAAKMGLSPDWARKLLKVSRLPLQIKDLLKDGRLPVTGAFYIADLPNAHSQLKVASNAATWGYSVEQIKAAVSQELNPDVEPQEGEYKIEPTGRPTRIPLRCHFCRRELPGHGKQYVWCCDECEKLAADMLNTYYKTLAAQAVTAPPGPPQKTPQTPPGPGEVREIR